MEKKKISAFEFVFMQAANPEKAKEYEPYSYWEERKMRIDNLAQKEQDLLDKMKTRDDQPAKIITELDCDI